MLLLIKPVTQVSQQVGQNILRAARLPLWFHLMTIRYQAFLSSRFHSNIPSPNTLSQPSFQSGDKTKYARVSATSLNPYMSQKMSTPACCLRDQSNHPIMQPAVEAAADQ